MHSIHIQINGESDGGERAKYSLDGKSNKTERAHQSNVQYTKMNSGGEEGGSEGLK